MIEYEIIRTKRKTLAIHIRPDGRVEVRAPFRVNKSYIDQVIEKKSQWITNVRNNMIQRRSEQQVIQLSQKEETEMKKKALAYFNYRCPFFAEKMGVNYNQIKVNKARTRWGSCNSKGEINFAYRLLFAPEDLIDYVIVHELAHLKEMNHSVNFWSIVKTTLPDYKDRRKRLRDFQKEIEIQSVN